MTLMSRLNHQAAVLERHARPESPGSTPPGPAAPLSPETVTPLKPSEALRLGRLTRPRRLTDGAFLAGDDAACALGAMSVGYGIDTYHGGLREWLAIVDQLPTACPLGCETGFKFGLRGVSHMNDDHRWSDDQIVAWLEGLGL